MRFIHISDLHFRRSDQKDIEIILGAFEESLTKEAKAGPIDLAFFTGDLVYSGDELDDFVSAEKLLCDAVTRATGIPRTRVILCPGNHDVSQKAYRADDMIDSALTSKLSSVATANDFFDNTAAYASYLELSLRPLANYRRFEEQHYDDMPLSPHELIRIRSVVVDDRLIGICIFNSAWRSTGGAGNDHKRLIIGERLVDLALEQVRNADMRIAVVHHPLDWLADFELQAVEAIFNQRFDFYLCGHIHASKPQAITSIFGHMIVSQCGALFSKRHYFNGYQIVDVDFDAASVIFHVFEWSDRIRSFTRCTGLLPDTNGTITLSLHQDGNVTETAKVGAILRLAKAHVRLQANEHVTLHRTKLEGVDDIKEVFVCPPLCHTRAGVLSNPVETKQRSTVSAESVLMSGRNWAILGERDSGKTSLGFLLSVLVSDGICDKPRLPTIIDSSAIPRYPQQVYGRVRRFLLPEDEKYPKWRDLNERLTSIQGTPLLIVVDNVSAANRLRLAEIEATLSKLQDCRWVLLCIQDVATRTQDLTKAFATPTEVLFIHDLPRRAIRELSRRRNELVDEDVQRMFPRIMDSIASA